MRGRWEAVRVDLAHSVSTLQAEQQFNKIKDAAFDRFASPSALVTYLNDPGGDLDEKDWIYGALVTAVQTKVEWSDLAAAVIWLGLWPALDHIYRRRLRHFLPETDDLVSAISTCFTAAVGRADLTRIRRVVATLTMNTERDLTDELKRRWKDEARRADLPEDERLAEERQVKPQFLEVGASESQEIAALRARLLPIVGLRDVDFVVAIVLGQSQREAGARLGLSHDASRKRFQSALGRIRESEGAVVPFQPRKVRL